MNYWPWWLSGLALTGVMLFHWFTLHRMMAVSGRISALINYLRHGKPETAPNMSEAELLAAIQAATAEEFTHEDELSLPENEHSAHRESERSVSLLALESTPPAAPEDGASLLSPPARSNTDHVLFLTGLVLGGFAGTVFVAGDLSAWRGEFILRSQDFTQLTGGSTGLSTVVLLFGGILVGFGTRMAGGCTSGHGLCGTSRLQPGSLLATLAFFGAGMITSFVLGFIL